jgi:ADP-heptose:LPS heptosyltransferase
MTAYKGQIVDLTGKSGLLESLAVIRRCSLFLANDTGPGKAAMALGVPTACVWGPSDWREQGVFWEPEKHLQISSGLPCQPCISLAIRNEGAGVLNFDNCGHRACLNELTAEQVAARIVQRYGKVLGR